MLAGWPRPKHFYCVYNIETGQSYADCSLCAAAFFDCSSLCICLKCKTHSKLTAQYGNYLSTCLRFENAVYLAEGQKVTWREHPSFFLFHPDRMILLSLLSNSSEVGFTLTSKRSPAGGAGDFSQSSLGVKHVRQHLILFHIHNWLCLMLCGTSCL